MKTILTLVLLALVKIAAAQQPKLPLHTKEEVKQKNKEAALKNSKRENPPITIEYCDYMLKSIDTKWNIVLNDSLKKAKAEDSGWFKRMDERKAFYTSEKVKLNQKTK